MKALYEKYESYCKENNEYILSKDSFKENIAQRGHLIKRGTGNKFFVYGILLLAENTLKDTLEEGYSDTIVTRVTEVTENRHKPLSNILRDVNPVLSNSSNFSNSNGTENHTTKQKDTDFCNNCDENSDKDETIV